MDISKFIIDESSTVLDAMKQLDKVGKKILFVVKKDKLFAALTDGDIRRWVIAKGDLKSPIKMLANYSPLYKHLNDEREVVMQYMRDNSIEALPLLNDEGEVKKIVFWDNTECGYMMNKVSLPVVMMAGGYGKRLYPYTNILPKPLIPIGEIPIAEHIINNFYKQGCEAFYLIVNYKKNMIKAYFNEVKKKYRVFYVDEDIPLGTGGGLGLLKGKIDSTFILTNCDILIREDFFEIYEFHKQQKNLITMVCSLKNFLFPYGVVEMGDDGCVEEMMEKPEIPILTNTGCYIVEQKIMEYLTEEEVVSFPEIIMRCKNRGERVGVYPIGENAWLDMGQFDEMENMKKQLKLE